MNQIMGNMFAAYHPNRSQHLQSWQSIGSSVVLVAGQFGLFSFWLARRAGEEFDAIMKHLGRKETRNIGDDSPTSLLPLL